MNTYQKRAPDCRIRSFSSEKVQYFFSLYLTYADEATSNVDAASEEDIWNCIHSLSSTKTLLIISHRLSTVRNADMIYVMKEGKVAESGRHDDLIAGDGIYAQLVREQNILENYGRRAG